MLHACIYKSMHAVHNYSCLFKFLNIAKPLYSPLLRKPKCQGTSRYT